MKLADLETGKHPAQQRLILEELLAHNLSMLALRAGAQRYHALPLVNHDELKNQLLAALPFKPTGAQERVVAEIERDMARFTGAYVTLHQTHHGHVQRHIALYFCDYPFLSPTALPCAAAGQP